MLRSGFATLEYEIAQEKASALGRLGSRLERHGKIESREKEIAVTLGKIST